MENGIPLSRYTAKHILDGEKKGVVNEIPVS